MSDLLKTKIEELERNDLDGAEGCARLAAAELGAVPGRLMYYLVMLQDDPAELNARLADVPATPDRGAV